MSTAKKSRFLALAAVLLAGAAAVAVDAGAGAGKSASSGIAKARMHDAQGNFLGAVAFIAQPGGKVAVRAATAYLTGGFHGFHVHAVGTCEPPFTSAGGHYDSSGAGHGHHAGDMPVLFVAQDGLARAEFQTDSFTVDELLDADGSAVIIHAGPDNYANIPTRYSASGPDAITLASGDAGARIACGVIERP